MKYFLGEDLSLSTSAAPNSSEIMLRENLQVSKHVLCLKGQFFQRCRDEKYFLNT